MHKSRMRLLSLTLALGMSVMAGAGGLSMETAAREYTDREQVLDTGFTLDTEYTLKLANPSEDISTTAANYYITGSSDPDSPLSCNGEEVESRGVYGSFGIYVELAMGENTFRFENGDDSQTLTITRTKAQTNEEVTTITNLRWMQPSSDDVVQSGEEYTIRCTAPANGKVTATLGEKSYPLKQEAVATTGVEAYYSAKITLPQAEKGKVEPLGKLSYQLTFDGKTTNATSQGSLYLVGKGAHLLARVNQNAAILYEEGESKANHLSLLSPGAMDAIVDSNDSYFQLSMGGWIAKSYVDLLPEQSQWEEEVSKTTYTILKNGESLVLDGKAAPAFKAYSTGEKIALRFYHTSGIELDEIYSELFSSVEVSTVGEDTVLEFYKKQGVDTVGYDVSYDGKGRTTVFFNRKADLGSSDQPLSQMTIVVDPGHGGLDSGALGVLNGNGPMEKDITMAHALVLKNRLESLGAQVVLAVSPQQDNSLKVEMTDRVALAKEQRADFYVSLHCNSIDANANGLKPSGTEIYYYENNSKLLADSILEKISAYNERDARSVIYGNFYVTRNSMCPSMLIEMGFISNPIEYDQLCTPDSMYQTANAIADALIEYLQSI